MQTDVVILLLTLETNELKRKKLKRKNGRDSRLPEYCVVNKRHFTTIIYVDMCCFVLWAVVQPRDVKTFPKSNKARSPFQWWEKPSTFMLGTDEWESQKCCECVSRAWAPQVKLTTQTKLARESQRILPLMRTDSTPEREREVVSSQPSGRRVLKMKTFSDYVGHGRTWGCQQAATKLNVPGRLRHSSVWQRAPRQSRDELVFFCMFVLLTLLGMMCYSRKQWNRDTWRWSGPFSRSLSLTPASFKSIKEVCSSLSCLFFRLFGKMCSKKEPNKNYFS